MGGSPDIEDKRKYSCVRLNTPQDVQELISKILDDICDQDMAMEMSGRVCNLLQVWLKAHEICRMTYLEKRIAALECEKLLEKVIIR